MKKSTSLSILDDIYSHMITMKTELLETLIRQCVKEVLDQVEEDINVGKLKSSGIGKEDGKEPAKQKIPIKPFNTGKKQKINIRKLNEDNGEPTDEPTPSPADQPAVPEDEPKAEPKAEPKPKEPAEPHPPSMRGAIVVNPRDKSRLEPIKWQGRDESSLERTLHRVAVSIAGARTKVSLGAKRMARELAANPSATAYFYFGKTDPESEEIFLMADKSIQIAKDDSVQPGELTGTPVTPGRTLPVGKWDEPSPEVDPKRKYADWGSRFSNRPITAKPRYGIDEPGELNEGVTKLIKTVVNKILSS